jgi:class 3 adenylate cyclase
MLQQVANQIGLALDNVRMLEALKREKQKAEAALLLNQKYSLYLPAPVVERLREDPEHADSLGGIPIRATVLFSDIKGFTQWAKDRDPQAVVAGLNRYFGAMDEVIASTGGIVDKRMGDGLMVVFLHPEGVDTGFFEQDLASGGADQPPPRHPAARALDCALRMQQAVAALAAGDAATGFPGLSVRIGVAHGSLVAGNLGSRHRIEYTVVGDVVNVASRLEQLCPPGEVLTTAATLQCAAGEPLCAEPFGERELDGREGAVALALVRRCG